MSAAVATRRSPSPSRRLSAPPEASAFSVFAPFIKPIKIGAWTVVGLAALVTAWNQLEWPKPATTGYVDGKVAVVSRKIDQVDLSTMQNRADTLTAAKARVEGEKNDLQLKLQLAATQKSPPDYIRMLNDRLAFLADQVTQLTNQINGVQTTITRKNAEAAK